MTFLRRCWHVLRSGYRRADLPVRNGFGSSFLALAPIGSLVFVAINSNAAFNDTFTSVTDTAGNVYQIVQAPPAAGLTTVAIAWTITTQNLPIGSKWAGNTQSGGLYSFRGAFSALGVGFSTSPLLKRRVRAQLQSHSRPRRFFRRTNLLLVMLTSATAVAARSQETRPSPSFSIIIRRVLPTIFSPAVRRVSPGTRRG